MRNESEIRAKLDDKDILLSEHLGQHILIDEGAISTVVGQIEYGINVLEIGSGPGNLTERIADRAKRVVGVEIDQRFKPLLDNVQQTHPNVEIIYKDAISLNFGKIIKAGFLKTGWQIASNLPFHISEPFMQKLIEVPIESAVLVVGDQLARRMQIENPNDMEFSRLSLLTQTFFQSNIVSYLGKRSFYPQPRTDAAIVVLNPRGKREFENNPGQSILKNLFLTERRNPSIVKVIKDSGRSGVNHVTMPKTESHRYERRQTKRELGQMTRNWQYGYSQTDRPGEVFGNSEVDKLNLPGEILNKPFSRLDNQDIRTLTKALRRRYG
ncbi:MAG: rRNA adenine dimethyltransferase family protein [bacterium]